VLQVKPASTVHVEEHPSPFVVLPSSHDSPVFLVLFPQV
jgi:hypothetical protein